MTHASVVHSGPVLPADEADEPEEQRAADPDVPLGLCALRRDGGYPSPPLCLCVARRARPGLPLSLTVVAHPDKAEHAGYVQVIVRRMSR